MCPIVFKIILSENSIQLNIWKYINSTRFSRTRDITSWFGPNTSNTLVRICAHQILHSSIRTGRDSKSEDVYCDNHSIPDILGSLVLGDIVFLRWLQNRNSINIARSYTSCCIRSCFCQSNLVFGATQRTAKSYIRPFMLQF